MAPLDLFRKRSQASATNEEWPVLTMHVSSCQQYHEIVPTKKQKNDTLRIDTIKTNDDLAALKKKDAFLYYSIPSVRDASMLLQDVDVSALDKTSIRRNCISCPGRMETRGVETSSVKEVKRRSCISFECHADLIMNELLDGNSRSGDNEEKLGEDGDLEDLLRMLD